LFKNFRKGEMKMLMKRPYEMIWCELTFSCYAKDDGKVIKNTGQLSRVILVESLEVARKIAKAMKGEEVYAREFLDKVVSVKETDKETSLVSWDVDYTWQHVLDKLKLVPEDVDFVFSESGKKIGLRFKRSSSN